MRSESLAITPLMNDRVTTILRVVGWFRCITRLHLQLIWCDPVNIFESPGVVFVFVFSRTRSAAAVAGNGHDWIKLIFAGRNRINHDPSELPLTTNASPAGACRKLTPRFSFVLAPGLRLTRP